MPWNPRPADPAKVFMIECHDLPTEFAKDHGDYEFKWGNKPEEIYYHDVVSLKKELTKLVPDQVDDILDRLQNFRLAYVNLETGEIFS